MPVDESGLRLYSLGVVLKAKVRGDDYISVDPIEKLTLDKGPISGTSKMTKASLPNQHGVRKTSSMQGGSAIVAKWIAGDDSNRQTPPDVQPGETVRIYSFGDTNDYYWTTLFREPGLRRLETVRHSFCNLPGGSEAFGDDTSYWVEYSTHDKHVKLHTSSNDGEPASYDIMIDAKNGELSFTDDLGNDFLLRSTQGKLIITTTAETEVNTVKATVNASESVDYNTGTFTVNAGAAVFNAPVDLKQGFTSTGSSGGAAGVLNGPLEMNGEIHGNADISTSGAVHGSNIS